ncbi:MAG: hypothetical protein LBB93_04860 [Elusimicrobiota bacterium]|jgi:uncharacterized protein YoxC|nr:hypothetical protein [Elusimicrobiota bacterium]
MTINTTALIIIIICLIIITLAIVVLSVCLILLAIRTNRIINEVNVILNILREDIRAFDKASHIVVNLAQKLSLPIAIVSNFIWSKGKKNKGGKKNV